MTNGKSLIKSDLKEKFWLLLLFCVDTIFSILLYGVCLCAAKIISYLKDNYLPFEGLLFKCVFLLLEYSFLIIGALIAIYVFVNEAIKLIKDDKIKPKRKIKHKKKEENR